VIPGQSWATPLALACLVVLSGCDGGNSAPPARQGSLSQKAQGSGAQFFQDAIDILNRPDEFDSQAALLQVVDRLNEWAVSEEVAAGWQLEPLLKTLPAGLRKIPAVAGLANSRFEPADAEQLRQVVWLREISAAALRRKEDPAGLKFIRRGDPEALKAGLRLFDWTIRNIQLDLEPPAEGTPARQIWQTLLIGRGSAEERAWCFMLLARQQGLDVVLLEPKKAQGSPRRLVGLLAGEELYLFDPELGLPLPGPNADAPAAAQAGTAQPGTVPSGTPGMVALSVGTLGQLAADDTLLRRLDLDVAHPYPLSASDLNQVTALIEASPVYLSARMQLVESRAVGQQKFVLSLDASALAERLKKVTGVAQVEIWRLPYERLAGQGTLDAYGLTRGDEALRRFRLPVLATKGGKSQAMQAYADPTFALPTANKEDTEELVAVRVLWKGRTLHLLGKYRGDPSANLPYTQARTALGDREVYVQYLVQKMTELSEADGQRLREYVGNIVNKLPEAERAKFNSLDALIRELPAAESERFGRFLQSLVLATVPAEDQMALRNTLEIVVEVIGRQYTLSASVARQDASYWLGLVCYERGDLNTAVDYFEIRTLRDFPDGPWTNAARYHLGRTREALGQTAEAAALYTASEGPQQHGDRLRARWLGESAAPIRARSASEGTRQKG